jgi:fatty acid-binding protein DegV
MQNKGSEETEVTITDSQSTGNIVQLFMDKLMELAMRRAKRAQMEEMLKRMQQEYDTTKVKNN